jgi:heterotetrameric sarcosine oxidase gamma subunit
VRLRELRAGLVEVTARRGQESVLDAALRRELGVGLPAQGRACGSGDVAALWIAPATLLIVAVPERLAPLFRNVAPSVAAVVDQSGGFVLLCLEGPMVIAALAKGCRLDLAAHAFPNGSVARTLIAQVSVILHRSGDTRFELFVPATFARSFADLVCHAAAEFGCTVLPPSHQTSGDAVV